MTILFFLLIATVLWVGNKRKTALGSLALAIYFLVSNPAYQEAAKEGFLKGYCRGGECPQFFGKIKTNTEPKKTSDYSTPSWRVYNTTSPMDDSQGIALELDATNEVQAWLKNVRPTLTVRCKENRTEIYVHTYTQAKSGAYSYQKAGVRIRIDKNPAYNQSWGKSTDGEALFAPHPIQLAKSMLGAEEMIFEFLPFNSSLALVRFNLRGFYSHIGKVAAACGWAISTR